MRTGPNETCIQDRRTFIRNYGYHETVNAKWNIFENVLDSLNNNGSVLFCKLPNCSLSKAEGDDGYHPDVAVSQLMVKSLSAFIEKGIYQ